MKYVIVFLFAILFVAFAAAAPGKFDIDVDISSRGAYGSVTGPRPGASGLEGFIQSARAFAARNKDLDI